VLDNTEGFVLMLACWITPKASSDVGVLDNTEGFV